MKNKSAIIFGAGGQDGFYLSELLRTLNIEVIGVSRKGDFLIGDVGDYSFVNALIKDKKPDYIFHLAAESTTAHEAWLANHNAISNGSLYILESVKIHSPSSKVFLAGSGLQFVNKGLPIKESDEFIGSSPYAVSRIQSVYASRYYRSLGIQSYIGYFFNHDSPLRGERHMSMKIAAAVNRIANGSTEKISIGDLNAKKEWGYAKDIVKAVWTLINQDLVPECVIGTGCAHALQDWVDICFAKVNKSAEKYLEKNNNYTSPYAVLVSDPATILSLGWRPEVNIDGLAELMLAKTSANKLF